MTTPKIIKFRQLTVAQQRDVLEYLDDTAAGWVAEQAIFEERCFPITFPEQAETRPYEAIEEFIRVMAGRTYSNHLPILLDSDLSLIDGAHRIADRQLARESSLTAFVRMRL